MPTLAKRKRSGQMQKGTDEVGEEERKLTEALFGSTVSVSTKRPRDHEHASFSDNESEFDEKPNTHSAEQDLDDDQVSTRSSLVCCTDMGA